MLAGRRFRGDLDAARRWVDSVLDELEALAEVKADPAVDRRGWTSALKSLLWSRSRRLDLDQPRRPGPHRIVRRSSEADWARWKAENPGRGFEP